MQGAKIKLPQVYLEYQLCKEFKWTLQELYAQPGSIIDEFVDIMGIEMQFEKRDTNSIQKYGKKR